MNDKVILRILAAYKEPIGGVPKYLAVLPKNLHATIV
jgi:hypothetical protein